MYNTKCKKLSWNVPWKQRILGSWSWEGELDLPAHYLLSRNHRVETAGAPRDGPSPFASSVPSRHWSFLCRFVRRLIMLMAARIFCWRSDLYIIWIKWILSRFMFLFPSFNLHYLQPVVWNFHRISWFLCCLPVLSLDVMPSPFMFQVPRCLPSTSWFLTLFYLSTTAWLFQGWQTSHLYGILRRGCEERAIYRHRAVATRN